MLFKIGKQSRLRGLVAAVPLPLNVPLKEPPLHVPLHVHLHLTSTHLCAATTRTYSTHNQPPPPPSPDLSEYLHGRRGNERKDSVTDYILLERKAHQARLDELPSPDKRVLQSFSNRGFGTKKRKLSSAAQSIVSDSREGAAVHLTSAGDNWPVFRHILPEVAFAGHSNCGKSTLVNILAGYTKKKGPAGVSDRAGWTDMICFYQVGRKPPLLIISDLPGYGHAVATPEDVKSWKVMTRDYLGSRLVLSRCLVLVDCSRGLCPEDISLLKYLQKSKVSWQVVLTKCDLLSVDSFVKSLYCVERDLMQIFQLGTSMLWGSDDEATIELNREVSQIRQVSHRLIVPVSSNTGAGIMDLWKEIFEVVEDTSVRFKDSEEVGVATDDGSSIAESRALDDKITSSKPLMTIKQLDRMSQQASEGRDTVLPNARSPSSTAPPLSAKAVMARINPTIFLETMHGDTVANSHDDDNVFSLDQIFPQHAQRELQAKPKERDRRVREHVNAHLLRKAKHNVEVAKKSTVGRSGAGRSKAPAKTSKSDDVGARRIPDANHSISSSRISPIAKAEMNPAMRILPKRIVENIIKSQSK